MALKNDLPSASSEVSTNQDLQDAEEYETKFVHDVYQQIAGHFSETRYKPWPIVERFLLEQKPGSIGLDVGCGNGKYLKVNQDIFIIGSDRSRALVQIAAQHQPHTAVVADVLHLPHPDIFFDFAISIAVIHHLSTSERRIQAIRAILQTLKKNPSQTSKNAGKALIYVWALEQKSSRRGWDKGHEQDVMVPWILRGKNAAASTSTSTGVTKEGSSIVRAEDEGNALPGSGQEKVFHRFYHLYQEGELEGDICAAGGVVVESGYEKDNWWAIATTDHFSVDHDASYCG